MIILRFHITEFHMLLWIIYHMLCLHFPNPWKNFKYLVSALLSNALHRLSRKLNCFKIFTLSAGSADSAIFSPSRLITSTVGLRSSSNLWRSYKKAIRHQVIKKHCNNTSLIPEGAWVLDSVLKEKKKRKNNAYIVIKVWIMLIKETPAPAPPLPHFLVSWLFWYEQHSFSKPKCMPWFLSDKDVWQAKDWTYRGKSSFQYHWG